ncbi:MAG: helicase-related protein [Acidobacteriota bacterium]|nr:helicase-related protein [Acidobacteriota bacterium]
MLKLEDVKKGCQVHGIEVTGIVEIVSVDRDNDEMLTVIYRNNKGNIREQMLFREDEPNLELAVDGKPWNFDAPGSEFKLALEAYRIDQAHLFDPMMAVHSAKVIPLPHQISAVYEAMLPRQPLRFVLADDPGAGKTIMAGLLIRELILRADARRILIVAPGSLIQQWQDELLDKFDVHFEIFSREKQEQCAAGNYFAEKNLILARIDQIARNEDYQAKLVATEWDLIVVDEAHKMSASYFGKKIKRTRRFILGEMLGARTRHYLLMTATPHNGKQEEFQLFMSLLDPDRFYGKFRNKATMPDVSDIMRRMVKEELLKFDGTRLFPERRAYTAGYRLSPLEENLYDDVTAYVRHGMDRAELLDGRRRGNVGFALTILQRRLASSPEAIFQSLKRREQKLSNRLKEIQEKGGSLAEALSLNSLDEETLQTLDDFSSDEYEDIVDEVADQATAAGTLEELETEIAEVRALTKKAQEVVASGKDRKWEELSKLLQDSREMYDENRKRRKLLIFTEHRDTLNYLLDRIGTVLGNPEAVVCIHGGTRRDDRGKIQEAFRFDPDVLVLIATDAASEGVNLQNANLMVNYDLPWNPNRLEQRFGRIHRIGQEEVCHLWNLVAMDTREGMVFQRLLEKLEAERLQLGGRVFDILGEAFSNVSLEELLIEAIRYGEKPETKDKMKEVIEGVFDREHLKDVMKRQALFEHKMTQEDLFKVKEEMEKAEARKLQPYFVRAYFMEAFKKLNGAVSQRERGRYEIRHVPVALREHHMENNHSLKPVLKKYERVCFEKDHVHLYGKPLADMLHPGHPLMKATSDLILQQHRGLLKQGTVMVDPADETTAHYVLFMIDHSICDSENDQVVSRRLRFVAIKPDGTAMDKGWAPHLDLRPINPEEEKQVDDILDEIKVGAGQEKAAIGYAARRLIPNHLAEVKRRREAQADKTMAAVQERLVKEINFQTRRALELEEEVRLGKQPKMAPEQFKRRVEELSYRLEQRKKELQAMKNLSPRKPVVIGGALVIPQGLLEMRRGNTEFCVDAAARKHVETVAMNAVIATEQGFGHTIKDVSSHNCGWDITSQPPVRPDGSVPDARHIEVKGRVQGKSTVTITRNERLTALNQGEKYILAIVIVDGDRHEGPYYLPKPFSNEPEPDEESINMDLKKLLGRAVSPQDTL